MSRPVLSVCATAFLYMLGLSVLFPVLPVFVRELGISDAQAGVLLSSYALGTVLTGSLWGRWSQRVGRRPTLLIGLAGFVVAFLGFALGRGFGELLTARFVGGLLAGALMPSIPAYIADLTSAGAERSRAMGLFGAAAGLGVMFGVVLGGVLGELGSRLPFFTSAAIGALAFASVAVGLPESLSGEARGEWSQRRRLGQVSAGLAAFLVYSFLVQTSRSALEVTIGFLALDRFGAGSRDVGWVLGGVTLLAVLVQGGGMRFLSTRFADRALLRAGTLMLGLGLFAVGFAPSWAALCTAGALCGGGAALLEPSFRAELSRAGAQEQGEAQGLNSAVQSLARVVAFGLFPWLYALAPRFSVDSALLAFGVSGTLALGAVWIAQQYLRVPELAPSGASEPPRVASAGQ